MANEAVEFWLRGPVHGICPVLQPVVHAILQAQLEIRQQLSGFPPSELWSKPAGAASVGFHLQHIAGVLDRLFTYARGEQLSEKQLSELQKEGIADEGITLTGLLVRLESQITVAIEQLKNTGSETVFAPREVGRKKLPSNVLGLLFHAAEHTQRHTGQLLVTAKVLKAENNQA